MNSFNHKLQLKNTEYAIRNKLTDLLSELRGFKFVTTLVIEFKKIESDDAVKYTTFYSNSKAKATINDNVIDDLFESIYNTVISSMQKHLGKGLGCIIDSLVSHTINIYNYYTIP